MLSHRYLAVFARAPFPRVRVYLFSLLSLVRPVEDRLPAALREKHRNRFAPTPPFCSVRLARCFICTRFSSPHTAKRV